MLSVGCDKAVEDRIRYAKVTASKSRTSVTVFGQIWQEDKEDRDGQGLVWEERLNGIKTFIVEILPVSGRSHVGCIDSRVPF